MLKQEIEDGDVTLADPLFRSDVLRGFGVLNNTAVKVRRA